MSLIAEPIEHNSPTWLSAVLLKRGRPFVHALFWLSVLLFYTLYFGSREDGYGQSLLFVILLLPITVLTAYFLLYWLIPRYLLQRRYISFFLYLCYTILFSLYLELLLVLLLYINVSEYQAMFVNPALVDLLDVLVGMYLVIFLAVAINLLRRWLHIQAFNSRLEKARMEAEIKLKETELQLLKSQIQPHFLFNTLNNLYALALQKSEQVPDVVLSISEQLDYVLYRGDSPCVPLTDELNHIQNYIKLQSLRYTEQDLKVVIETSGEMACASIAPLLLIPFVENSFKHGINPSYSSGWITMRSLVQNNRLTFYLANSKCHIPSEPDQHSGIGLLNVRKRLELLYTDRYTLDVHDESSRFIVQLTLQLDEPT